MYIYIYIYVLICTVLISINAPTSSSGLFKSIVQEKPLSLQVANTVEVFQLFSFAGRVARKVLPLTVTQSEESK